MALPIMEISARVAEATLLAVVDAFPDAVILVDEEDVVRGFNQASERAFGFEPAAVIGGPASTFVDLSALGRHQAPGELIETVGTRNDGTCFLLQAAVSELSGVDGQLRIISLRDAAQEAARRAENEVSREQLEKQIVDLSRSRENIARQREEMRELAHDLAEARDKAELADREKTDFLAIMSHELRTPLNGILGMATLLSASTLTDEQRRQTEMVKQAGDALLVIVNDLLDLAKIETGQLNISIADFDFHRFMEDVAAFWEPQATERGLNFDLSMPSGSPQFLLSDSDRIRQILNNYLNNAVKFTASGSVTLAVEYALTGPGKVKIRFSVSDTGRGVGEEHRDRLFKRYSQTDDTISRRYGGTGLGLAICKQLSELMGGHVGFESEFGEGSIFWCELTCRLGNPTNVRTAFDLSVIEDFNRLLKGRSLDILLAEDSRINQAVIEGIFEQSPHRLTVAKDGEEAARLAGERSYDVILMDHYMPVMDGIEAANRIRETDGLCKNTPIIALTANAMAEHRDRYTAAGMNDYVSKPLDPGALFDAIARSVLEEAPGEVLADRAATRSTIVSEPITPRAKDLLEDLDEQLNDVLSHLKKA